MLNSIQSSNSENIGIYTLIYPIIPCLYHPFHSLTFPETLLSASLSYPTYLDMPGHILPTQCELLSYLTTSSLETIYGIYYKRSGSPYISMMSSIFQTLSIISPLQDQQDFHHPHAQKYPPLYLNIISPYIPTEDNSCKFLLLTDH